MLIHKRRSDDDFYHKEIPLFYSFDVVQPLEDCPIPLKNDSEEALITGSAYEIVAYAVNHRQGYKMDVILVNFVSVCGHRELRRIEFDEQVKDFEHYGTKYIGAHYSIKNYPLRIETFRNFKCEVCSTVASYESKVQYRDFSYNTGKKKLVAHLENNFENWQDYFNPKDFKNLLTKAAY